MVANFNQTPSTIRHGPQTAALRPVGTYPNLLWRHLPGEKWQAQLHQPSGREGVQESIVSNHPTDNNVEIKVFDLKPVNQAMGALGIAGTKHSLRSVVLDLTFVGKTKNGRLVYMTVLSTDECANRPQAE